MVAESGGPELLILVAGIIALGVAAQVVADRFQIPSVLFLILAGILLGPVSEVVGSAVYDPSFPGLVHEGSFGDALPAIVGLSVAIIVFEGAFHLKAEKLQEAPRASLRLVTFGALVSLLGTALVVRFVLGASWSLSFLIGALLVATGPTVITPIMDVVPVRDRVAIALETEGIVNDVTAAILAIVVFESVTFGDATFAEFLRSFLGRLGIGVIAGLAVAAALWYLIRFVDLSPGSAPQNARLMVLGGALLAYAGAEMIAPESGIAAVATAGVVLGNADLPYEEEIEAFKGDITLLVLSFVFIALAALLDFGDLLDLGVEGIVVVLVVTLLVRPALVFLSLIGDRFTTSEKLFVSLVGPRGIIPASVATLFALQLSETDPAGASVLVGTVFLVILATVTFEGGLARHLAETLDVIPMRVIIVGGGTVGRALATRLEDRGENVVLVEEDVEQVEIARNEGFTVHHGDGTDTEVLRSAGAENARIVIAATGDDDANLLVAQLSKSKFDAENVIARANNPGNVDAFEDLGVQTISSADATAWAMDNAIERPAMARWMTRVGQEGDVQEIEVTNPEMDDATIGEVDAMLPDEVLIALVTRDGGTFVPGPDTSIAIGDHLTILGDKESVREAMGLCGGA
ncbi:MAG: cation:proton antiporter [Halobacteriales archaeon]